MRSRKTTDTHKLMDQATDYASWRTHAAELDVLQGLDEWKDNPNSKFYQYKLIQQRLINLKNWRRTNDWPELIFSLREGLHRNLGNLANPELYKHTHVGTKALIDEYITEVTALLNHLCDHDIAELPYNQKLLFFRHTGQSF